MLTTDVRFSVQKQDKNAFKNSVFLGDYTSLMKNRGYNGQLLYMALYSTSKQKVC